MISKSSKRGALTAEMIFHWEHTIRLQFQTQAQDPWLSPLPPEGSGLRSLCGTLPSPSEFWCGGEIHPRVLTGLQEPTVKNGQCSPFFHLFVQRLEAGNFLLCLHKGTWPKRGGKSKDGTQRNVKLASLAPKP